MKRHLSIAIALLLVAAAVSGCSKSGTPTSPLGAGTTGTNGATPLDVAQVATVVVQSPVYINEDQYTTTAQVPMLLATPGASIIRPIRWWRTIDSTQRVVTTVFSDPDSLGRPRAAVATIQKHFTGWFNIFAGDTALADTARRTVRKPLDDEWTRQLSFVRAKIDTAGKISWRLVGTSGVTVTSNGATTQIQSVRIQTGTLDTTITDPQQMYKVHHILWFHHDAPVTVTVRTGRPDDIVVLYHGWERRPFKANGDNTYTALFADPDFGGLRHFGVNAFSRGTLWDDTAPYDSQAWVFPFGSRDRDCWVDRR